MIAALILAMFFNSITSVTPTSLDFGATPVGGPTPLLTSQVLSGTNISPVLIIVSSITITGPDASSFTFDTIYKNSGSPQADGGNNCHGSFTQWCDVRVTFTPTEFRTYSATLTVNNDSDNMPTLTIPLSGQGADLRASGVTIRGVRIGQ